MCNLFLKYKNILYINSLMAIQATNYSNFLSLEFYLNGITRLIKLHRNQLNKKLLKMSC